MSEPHSTGQLHAVEINNEGRVVTAKLVGPVVEENRAAVILDSVKQAIERAGDELRFVVLDFGEVGFINSSGLAACIELRNGVTQRGVTTIAYRPNDDLLDIFKKSKLDKLYTVVQTAAELEVLLDT